MTTPIPLPRLSGEMCDLTAVATGSTDAALFQAVALAHSGAYREHIRQLLLIGLEDIGEE